jgi:peptide-methionine (S)-S-oxide reductase
MTMGTRVLTIIIAATLAAAAGHAKDEKPQKKIALATFAGGCFWCMEPAFDDIKGVKSTTSGYTGGPEKNPTYKQVSSGKTGHAEAIQIEYDPAQVTYEKLLEVYWHNVDPTVTDRQFCDWGKQYRPEIFYHDEEQKRLAEASKKDVEKKFGEVPVRITAAGPFYPAEEYHQDYYSKNPDDYHSYRKGCGRDRRLKELWGEAAGR